MPEQLVDAHVHLWDLANPWYPGLQAMATDTGNTELYTDFGLDDYRQAAGEITVSAMVHVSATTAPRTYLDELRWVTASNRRDQVQMRFIGTVDPAMSRTQIVADLDKQSAITSRLAGIRVLYGMAPDSMAAHTVLRWLQEHQLVFDLVAGPDTLPAWTETLAGYPELSVVLEHAGWPAGTDPASRAQWLDAITTCAQRTSARCKISGLGMVTGDLSVPALRPWVEHAVDVFGWDRVLFGSNMPIEGMAGTYSELQRSLQTIIGEAELGEQQRFYSVNAYTIYGFGDRG